ncbi:MAG: low molecular weight protein arginine phosphatase [Syntrophomonadaceae bacterium]|nr:low molecular weight protein arginine phosphatase [Syntrophomonadaceae bacterium]
MQGGRFLLVELVIKIVFVCTGNTCRSPMAQALFRKIIEDSNMPGHQFKILSAGLNAVRNQPATAEAIDVMKMFGIDLSAHQAIPIEDLPEQDVDILFTMTKRQAETLKEMLPAFENKVFTLSGFVETEKEIEDPFGLNFSVYQKCADDLLALLSKALDKIKMEYEQRELS